ncbi:hypothetical protein ACSSV1_000051 [Labrenzia sp. MBR-25]
MSKDGDQLAEGLKAAMRFAATRKTFTPRDAVEAASKVLQDKLTPLTIARLLAELNKVVQEVSSGPVWSLRNGARHGVLKSIETPEEDTPVARALRGDEPYSQESIERLIAETPDLPAQNQLKRIEDISDELDRAGPSAPAYPLLVRLRGVMNRVDAARRAQTMLSREFFGREKELARLLDWCNRPQEKTPVSALFITGLPGIGKSFLIDRAIAEYRSTQKAPVVLRLDFDRRGLNLEDPDKLVHELSRQLGDILTEEAPRLRDLRLKYSGSADTSGTTVSSTLLPTELVDAMGAAVRSQGGQVVLVLDTLEVLRGHGETRPILLFEVLDNLVRAGLSPISIIAAGRGDALDSVRKRIEGSPLELNGLSETDSRNLLDKLGAPPDLHDRIFELSRGNPLMLRLSAKVTQAEDFDPGELEYGEAGSITEAYLYRAILSRIDDPLLARLAHPGLVLRRISAEAIQFVLAPALGLGDDIDEAASKRLWQELSSHHWLVAVDGQDWLKHRSDLRREILPMLYVEKPELAARIDRVAADWFAGIDRETALYHAFQATRAGDAMPPFTAADVAGLSDDELDELPLPAANAILQERGQRSRRARYGSAEQGAPEQAAAGKSAEKPAEIEPELIRELEQTLRRGDVFEADHIFTLNNAFPRNPAPTSPEAAATLAYFWLSGQWARAMSLWRKLPKSLLERLAQEDPGLYRLVLLEIEAEADFDGLVTRLRHDEKQAASAWQARAEGSRIALKGALEFALMASQEGRSEYVEILDPVAMSVFRFGEKISDYPADAIRQGANRAERFAIMTGEQNPVTDQHTIARMNPAISPLSVLARIQHSPRMAQFLRGFYDGLHETLAMLGTPDLFDSFERYASDIEIEGPEILGALGLTSDWAGAFAIFNAVPDAPTVARAAERWRRFSGGIWSYPGSPPPDWGNGERDILLEARVDSLLSEKDPPATARALLRRLAYAADYPDTEEGARRARSVFERRLKRPLAKAMTAGGAQDIAAVLAPRLMGPALTAALAVIGADAASKNATVDASALF